MKLRRNRLFVFLLSVSSGGFGFAEGGYAVGIKNNTGKAICVSIAQETNEGGQQNIVCRQKGKYKTVLCPEPKEGPRNFIVSISIYNKKSDTCGNFLVGAAGPGQRLIFEGDKLCCCHTKNKSVCQ